LGGAVPLWGGELGPHLTQCTTSGENCEWQTYSNVVEITVLDGEI